MSIVVNVIEIRNRFDKLGWLNLRVDDVLTSLKANNIPAETLILYLNAAIANPAGFDDAAIQGAPAAQCAQITQALQQKGLAAT